MSDQLYTQEQIVNHQENASPTKFMWSFARAKRFPDLDRRGFSDSLYNFPRIGNAQKCGIGYGNKTDFTKRALVTEIVGVKRDYDTDAKPRGVSYSFGESRDKYGKVYCPGYKNFDKNVPGPGKYNSFLNTMGNMGSPAYTFRPKCGDLNWNNKIMNNPGPGAYDSIVKINTSGKYPISRVTNVKSRNFGIDRIDRFSNYRYNHIPGPNAYKNKNGSLIGHQIFDSRYKSPSFVSMSQRFRIIDRNEKNPGPGSYIRFSEFGILAPKRDLDKSRSKEKEEIKNSNSNENMNQNKNSGENLETA